MADFDGIITPSATWVDIPSLSNTAIALGGTAGAGVMNAQATALTKRTNYLFNYSVQINATTGNVGIGQPAALRHKLSVSSSIGIDANGTSGCMGEVFANAIHLLFDLIKL